MYIAEGCALGLDAAQRTAFDLQLFVEHVQKRIVHRPKDYSNSIRFKQRL